MQLEPKKSNRIASTLGILTASLLATAGANAQVSGEPIKKGSMQATQPIQTGTDFDDNTYTDEGLIRIDAAVLVYQEDGGRVRAIEPVLGVTYNFEDQSSLSLKFTADILTGASPYGATLAQGVQTLVNPPSTGASGSAGTISTTDVPAEVLPIATGFNDQRYAVDASYVTPWGEGNTVSISAGVSKETDYKSFYGGVGLSRELNQKNTTLSASANMEYNVSSPPGGHPRPLTVAGGRFSLENDKKTVIGGLIGVSQVMNRRWLAQLNYNISTSSGYQTDPYRVISVVDSVTGDPVRYLNEARPESRLRQSIYFGNKVALGSTVTDASVRLYHDDWGINSLTLNLAVRTPVTNRFYLKPGIRYYSQSSADFFNYYLVDGQALHKYASPDARLDKFSALTGSLMVGYKTSKTGEIYARVSRYEPSSKTNTSNAPGYLSGRDLFSGTASTSMIIGYTYAFK
ncbi:MAG: hypothetical protein COC03_02815 [Robiginitomaculum sp.]|nr:MAG: hypothetical protein COC03_02815 [Robiginitomaculum sp.]PHQ67525.1 MAG: hypothetical protein COB92_04040 [Robiginitomaculum sp.]